MKKFFTNKVFLLGVLALFSVQLKAQDGGREFGFYNNILMQHDMIGMPVTMDWGFYMPTSFDMSISSTSPVIGSASSDLETYDLLTKVYNNMASSERLFADIKMNLFGFGFMPNDRLYLGFGVDLHLLSQLSISRDFLGVLYKGTYDGRNFTSLEFGDTQGSLLSYASFFTAASYKWDENWTFGAKFKILYSLAYFNAELESATLTPRKSDDGSFYQYNMKYKGKIIKSIDEDDVAGSIGGGGFGLDLGTTFSWENIDGYVGIENVPLISFLNSSSKTENNTYNGEVNINPASTNSLDLASLSDSISDIFDKVKEDIKDDKKASTGSADIYIPTHVNIAGKYQLAEINNFGFQSQFSFYEYQNIVDFTPFYMLNLWDYFQTKVGWTFSNRDNTNLNLDFSVNFGVQLFLGVQNLLSYSDLNGVSNASFRFGLAFGDFFGGSNDLDAREERKMDDDTSPLGMPMEDNKITELVEEKMNNSTTEETNTTEETTTSTDTETETTTSITELVDKKIGTPIQETEEAKKDLEEAKEQ